MESEPPAAWQGRKDNMSVTPKFAGIFIHQVGGRKGVSKDSQESWAKGWRRGQLWDRHRVYKKRNVPSCGLAGAAALKAMWK